MKMDLKCDTVLLLCLQKESVTVACSLCQDSWHEHHCGWPIGAARGGPYSQVAQWWQLSENFCEMTAQRVITSRPRLPANISERTFFEVAALRGEHLRDRVSPLCGGTSVRGPSLKWLPCGASISETASLRCVAVPQ
jgi:hypothetical protein